VTGKILRQSQARQSKPRFFFASVKMMRAGRRGMGVIPFIGEGWWLPMARSERTQAGAGPVCRIPAPML